MPQPKKTAAVHRIQGTYRPSRHRERKADAGGIGLPPPHLDSALAAIWNELAQSLPFGVGDTPDRIAFEVLAVLTSRMRTGKTTAAQLTQLRGLLDAFGLTPASRKRLDPEPPPPDPNEPLTGLARFRKPSSLDKYR